VTSRAAQLLHDAAMARMLDRHPRLRRVPQLVRDAYRDLYHVLEDVPLDLALDCIARRAEEWLPPAPPPARLLRVVRR